MIGKADPWARDQIDTSTFRGIATPW